MGAYIKGMEMPKCCGDCPYRKKINPEENQCFLNGKIFDETFSILLERRHADCPLVSVPPHGRLIDADAEISFNVTMEGGKCQVCLFAPTIIPAEEGE